MLHGVEVDVIEMALKVFDFFDRMFPKFWLPDSSPTIVLSSLTDIALRAAVGKPTLCELGFDPLPTARVVCISRRHAPDRVEMIGQQDDCATVERV